jgi:hypothetical protein
MLHALFAIIVAAAGAFYSSSVLAKTSAVVAAPKIIYYKIWVDRKRPQVQTYYLMTIPGHKISISDMGPPDGVTEIKSDTGVLPVEPDTAKTGLQASVEPATPDADGKFLTLVVYKLWDAGVVVSQGNHAVDLSRVKSVQLPELDGDTLTVTLEPVPELSRRP